MSEHYPRIRIKAESGITLIREGLSLCFYMKHPHREVAPTVLDSLDAYLRAIGPHSLAVWSERGMYWEPLDDAGWARIRRQLLERFGIIELRDPNGQEGLLFAYFGKPLDDPSRIADWRESVCTVSFSLPTEFLEEHGPDRFRALALELAAPLPFCSGHVGLAFDAPLDLLGVLREIRKSCFRYPGMDILDLDNISNHLDTRVRGPAWLTFLGQPVLGELGGVEGLRSRLHSPGTSVQDLGAERAVVTLGQWPEAGDTEKGNNLPAYRELARVLKPWMYHRAWALNSDFPLEDVRRWERRFLD